MYENLNEYYITSQRVCRQNRDTNQQTSYI